MASSDPSPAARASSIDRAADARFMRAALGLAARGLGRTWPNPAVGCVIVRDGAVVGRGWTQPGGRPHAETEALTRAGTAARGATAYTTLEPCSHHGRTPPCADALVEAGIARCVIAVIDPDPKVAGGGAERLRVAGVEVVAGVESSRATEHLAGYLLHRRFGRPLVTLKLASSLDGRIATHSGESRWITGEPARQYVHLLRARHDAVLIGVGTATADDPDLRCRLPGLEAASPARVVFDSSLQLPLTSRLVRTARETATWIVCSEEADALRENAFAACGVEVLRVPHGEEGLPDPAVALKKLGERGVTSVLVEGGSRLAASLVRAGLVDRIAWFRAPSVIGGDGIAAVAAFGLGRLADAPAWRRIAFRSVGDDVLETFARTI